jgi:hypothetical protein
MMIQGTLTSRRAASPGSGSFLELALLLVAHHSLATPQARTTARRALILMRLWLAFDN